MRDFFRSNQFLKSARGNKSVAVLLVVAISLSSILKGQDHQDHTQHNSPVDKQIEPQPLLAQALRLRESLNFLGSSLSATDDKRLSALEHQPRSVETVRLLQEILDPYCLALVNINPEGMVKVEKGMADARLIQGGWRSFILKIRNDAGVRSKLQPESPNALLPHHRSLDGLHSVWPEDAISPGQSANRFLEIQMYNSKPLNPHLSGLKLEYAVVQIYSKDAGKREVEIGFSAGQGSQDLGFRNTINILFDIKPSVKAIFKVTDDDGKPAMASFIITDSIERFPGELSAIYPLPSRRIAAYDEYPDFFFQPQVYRKDGEHVLLAPGKYHITYTRGPEYIPQTKVITIPVGIDSTTVSFILKRWINMGKLGWQSGDHHVHAAGCMHYDSPEDGVPPAYMWRQALGEDLNISAVLTWAIPWYNQKKYFTGKDDPLSTDENIIRYDVEVSGFPSSHAGHLALLRLKEDEYPGTKVVEDWPSWTLPILQWAKKQGGVVGYTHSARGLEPLEPTEELPNYVTPIMDGIGATEYIVSVAHDAVDIYSAGNTPVLLEMNMWYHTLNCGFRPRISGETDFPCITDERIGRGRSYFKAKGPVNFDTYVAALKSGHSYVSDGFSHIMNFSVNGIETGTKNSEIKIKNKETIKVSADIAAYLPEIQNEEGKKIAISDITKEPSWHIERNRIGASRNVMVELIVNGMSVDTIIMLADGKVNKVDFSYPVSRTCWLALRVKSSSHTNPFFIEVAGEPIKEERSAEWCIRALNQCWLMKEPNIRQEEKEAAKAAYDKARKVYESIMKQASVK